jgi:hypothetical protein
VGDRGHGELVDVLQDQRAQQVKDTSKAYLVVVLESRTKDRLDEDCGRAKSGSGAP